MNRRLFGFAVLSSFMLFGCDNTATVPAPETGAASENTSVAKEKDPAVNEEPITIGYSDWPGWVAWQIAIDKGWFEAEDVNVEFKWFDYSASLSAFAANQLDAISVTNGDNLVNAASGSEGIIILVNDYSAGNDQIIVKPGIESIADLKGKSIGVEKGLVDHLLLNSALADNGLSESDVTLVNATTNELPQVFTNDSIDAVAIWQPNASQALKNVPGSKFIYTSADKPGLIYDTLAVSPASLSEHKDEYAKIVKIWGKVANYVNSPETRDDAIAIMAKKANVPAEDYRNFLNGTRFMTLEDNKEVFKKSDALTSIYGSSYNVNKFNIDNKIYDQQLDIDKLIYPNLIPQ